MKSSGFNASKVLHTYKFAHNNYHLRNVRFFKKNGGKKIQKKKFLSKMTCSLFY